MPHGIRAEEAPPPNQSAGCAPHHPHHPKANRDSFSPQSRETFQGRIRAARGIVLLVLGTLMALTRAAKEEEGAGVVEPGPASLRTKRETKAIVTPQVKKLLKIKKKHGDGAYGGWGGGLAKNFKVFTSIRAKRENLLESPPCDGPCEPWHGHGGGNACGAPSWDDL
ncbi:unnamed protein product [Darwinula stevensoni]|uniref:Uncharacterized protein n=1 Tax=Darwinula stevensoni TaxID=69355 RepID=A0A7R8X428_9CRUS|nr:unnamed protein product [Darwinula stevensoni]CAG0885178.1 unnamed protein product [Darwinula stevensoni]